MCIDALQSAPKLADFSMIARSAYLRRDQLFQVSVFPDLTLLFQTLSFCSLRCLCYPRDTMLPQISAQVMHAKIDDHTLAMLGMRLLLFRREGGLMMLRDGCQRKHESVLGQARSELCHEFPTSPRSSSPLLSSNVQPSG